MEPIASKKTLPLASAKKIAERAEKYAVKNRLAVVIAIVDEGAHPLCLFRMDGAPLGSVTIAQDKARTAVIFKSPTKAFEDGLNAGVTSLLKCDILPFEGGLPLTVDGQIVGGIGVSGGSQAQDGQVAAAGAAWLAEAVGRA